MEAWPHKETPLTEPEKEAYRYLLYHAMLDIRNLCQPRGPSSWNPLVWQRQYRYGRVAGALADWLHNLAYYVSKDFKGFDSDWFWQEYDGMIVTRCQDANLNYLDYRQRYESYLRQWDKG